MARPVPTSVRLDPELKAALESAAKKDGRSMSSMLDRILRKWLESEGHIDPSKD
jgi:predicted transcriptional regulator